MMGLGAMIKRNIKMFFKDKGLLFTSLITPIILLVLYATFLGNVYRDSFEQIIYALAPNLKMPKELIEGCVGGQLFSSLLAVCTILASTPPALSGYTTNWKVLLERRPSTNLNSIISYVPSGRKL